VERYTLGYVFTVSRSGRARILGANVMTLETGMMVRCTNPENEGGVIALVAIASENGKSVFVQCVDEPFRVAGGLAFSLPLMIDYEAETVTDILFGQRWELDVQEPE
jgi:hypothetical protein